MDDVTIKISISKEEASRGCKIRTSFDRYTKDGVKREEIVYSIPPNSKDGDKIVIQGKGNFSSKTKFSGGKILRSNSFGNLIIYISILSDFCSKYIDAVKWHSNDIIYSDEEDNFYFRKGLSFLDKYKNVCIGLISLPIIIFLFRDSINYTNYGLIDMVITYITNCVVFGLPIAFVWHLLKPNINRALTIKELDSLLTEYNTSKNTSGYNRNDLDPEAINSHPTDKLTKLRELKELLDSKTITKEEFDELKKEVIY